MRLILWIAAVIILTSCRTGGTTGAMEKAARAHSAAARAESGPIVAGKGEEVRPVFVKGRARNLIHKGENQTVYVAFDSEKGKRLKGFLTSRDSTANIRISKIILPDGSTDGPFGSDIYYDLPETGTYRLAIHENMMAGSPWGGDFKIELALK
ncbi:MAG: hypothetical protein LUE10_01745 [Alistipes sp.]|nr:hypothetical protein [Alistipes sp.]